VTVKRKVNERPVCSVARAPPASRGTLLGAGAWGAAGEVAMADDTRIKVHVESGGWIGVVWFWGWLYTLGFLHLAVPQAVWALAIWPYYLGKHFAH
jgi:hypothetical protein